MFKTTTKTRLKLPRTEEEKEQGFFAWVAVKDGLKRILAVYFVDKVQYKFRK